MVNKKNPQVLKRSSDFEAIKKGGKKINPTRWMILAYRKNELGILRYGFTVSRKVGTAVIRNRLKRWGREEFKNWIRSENKLEVDINVIFRPIDTDFYKQLTYAEFQRALQKALRYL